MKFSYFNFWVRNSVLYLFFCLLGLIILLFEKTDLIYDRNAFFRAILNGALIFLIAHIQVYIHNVFLYQKYFGKINWKYFFGTILLYISYFLINFFTPFRFVKSGDIASMSISIFLIYVVGLGFYYVHKNILERNLIYQSKLIKRDEEIRHLKAQLNPHFLFNALNNLYGTALTEPTETPDKILELADLLRYQIESSKKETVTVEEELQFIAKYLNYEQMRISKLTINFEQSVEDPKIQISPMLFMPFIENAIKYCSQTEKPFFYLRLESDRKTLFFKILNNFNDDRRKFAGTNTGILNTKKRLDLMYNNRHKLTIIESGDIYSVELSLKF